jgi:tRNA-Thr(GGU) m(6)t(6)A37 methyltransferase TsaA
MNQMFILTVLAIFSLSFPAVDKLLQQFSKNKFTVYAIGVVKKENGRSYILVDKEYQDGLQGLDQFDFVIVVYWFHNNDTPEKRSILRVHPKGNQTNTVRGVFATHAPVRPNLITISRSSIISVNENVIEVDTIDAFDVSPALDLKN